MSRKRVEFEHRTSIFEGAYRAWSHLGGLEPKFLESKSVLELDPISYPIEDDNRCITGKPVKKQRPKSISNVAPNSSEEENDNSNIEDVVILDPNRKIYPYEPLPRSGLAHPFVQAILSPWLGADANEETIETGLTTLRTWWQHRRRGESGSAIAVLGTEHMQPVVTRYVRHFFNLAHSLVTKENEQAPRTLMVKLNELEKARKKRSKKRGRDDEVSRRKALALNAGIAKDLGIVSSFPSSAPSMSSSVMKTSEEAQLTPLEKLYADKHGAVNITDNLNTVSPMNIISNVVSTLNTNLSYGAAANDMYSKLDVSSRGINGNFGISPGTNMMFTQSSQAVQSNEGKFFSTQNDYNNYSGQNGTYGNPNTTPVVLISGKGDIQIAMTVNGMTCSHCVKILETVLRGCNGNKSPISGLLDAVADLKLKRVLIKIDQSSSAKRIAFEAKRNLAMVGYTAEVKEMSTMYSAPDQSMNKMNLRMLSEAFLAVGSANNSDVFDWDAPCSCPDNGVQSEDCSRHRQINNRIFDAFDLREKKINKFVAGCGQRYGGDCTCGNRCQCNNCPDHPKVVSDMFEDKSKIIHYNKKDHSKMLSLDTKTDLAPSSKSDHIKQVPDSFNQDNNNVNGYETRHFAQSSTPKVETQGSGACCGGNKEKKNRNIQNDIPATVTKRETYGRRHSLQSAGGSSFGRAMSALSELSIDWDDMDDFDVELDHSANIKPISVEQDEAPPHDSDSAVESIFEGCAMLYGGACNCGPTCACVGCPVHGNNLNETVNVVAPKESQNVHKLSSYTFGQTGHRKPRRSSLKSKIPKNEQHALQNQAVTFQI